MKKIPHGELDALFEAVGWRARGESKWRTVMHRTSNVYSVRDGGKLVGFGRLFHDGGDVRLL